MIKRTAKPVTISDNEIDIDGLVARVTEDGAIEKYLTDNPPLANRLVTVGTSHLWPEEIDDLTSVMATLESIAEGLPDPAAFGAALRTFAHIHELMGRRSELAIQSSLDRYKYGGGRTGNKSAKTRQKNRKPGAPE